MSSGVYCAGQTAFITAACDDQVNLLVMVSNDNTEWTRLALFGRYDEDEGGFRDKPLVVSGDTRAVVADVRGWNYMAITVVNPGDEDTSVTAEYTLV